MVYLPCFHTISFKNILKSFHKFFKHKNLNYFGYFIFIKFISNLPMFPMIFYELYYINKSKTFSTKFI